MKRTMYYTYIPVSKVDICIALHNLYYPIWDAISSNIASRYLGVYREELDSLENDPVLRNGLLEQSR